MAKEIRRAPAIQQQALLHDRVADLRVLPEDRLAVEMESEMRSLLNNDSLSPHVRISIFKDLFSRFDRLSRGTEYIDQPIFLEDRQPGDDFDGAPNFDMIANVVGRSAKQRRFAKNILQSLHDGGVFKINSRNEIEQHGVVIPDSNIYGVIKTLISSAKGSVVVSGTKEILPSIPKSMVLNKTLFTKKKHVPVSFL